MSQTLPSHQKNHVTIEKAGVEDVSTIFQLAKSIWNDHYIQLITQDQIDYMLEWMYSANSLSNQMIEKNHQFYIIKNNDLINIGFFSFSKNDADYFLHKFYIDTKDQSKGIGTEVFNQFMSLDKGLKTIRLTVNRKNYKSINFYFKNGFNIEKVEDFEIGNGYLMEDFIMIYKK